MDVVPVPLQRIPQHRYDMYYRYILEGLIYKAGILPFLPKRLANVLRKHIRFWGWLTCPLCGREFAGVDSLRKHLIFSHSYDIECMILEAYG